MPHYKDWSGRFFQDPSGTGESWGSFGSKVDLTQDATSINWAQTESNSLPGLVTQNLKTAYWENNNLTKPEAFAIMVQPEYTNPDDTYFRIWDVTWNNDIGDISGQAPVTMSFQQILDNATSGQSTSFSSIDSLYFQVDSVPIPEPSSGMLLGLAMVWSLIALLARRFWTLSTRAAQGVKSVWMYCFM